MPTLFHMTKRITHGPAVRAMRGLVGIKQGEFAIRCDITPGYLANIEAGRKQPAPDVARRMATVLGVDLDAITYVIDTTRNEVAA